VSLVDRARPVPRYVRDAVVLGLAISVFGMAFGVLATTSGLSFVQACACSLLMFTGASQFAAVGVLASGGTAVAAAGPAVLLAARNALYGIAVAPLLPRSGWRRFLAAHLVLDESTALASAQTDPRDRRGAFLAGGLSVFVFWNLGTAVGAAGGAAIGNPAALGLDAAFPAGFVALVVPLLRSPAARLAAAVGVGLAVVAVPLTQPGVPILVAVLAVVPAALVARRRP
jgi:4-azaleucine resistance transporter AzlC